MSPKNFIHKPIISAELLKSLMFLTHQPEHVMKLLIETVENMTHSNFSDSLEDLKVKLSSRAFTRPTSDTIFNKNLEHIMASLRHTLLL